MAMSENEAIRELSYDSTAYGGRCTEEVRRVAIQALEEIQEYRAIGTIDEFKALKEKNEQKKPEVNEFDYGEGYVCGECESFLHYVDDDDEHIRTNYCCHCGTKIDWQ